jgi:hypothetical protein
MRCSVWPVSGPIVIILQRGSLGRKIMVITRRQALWSSAFALRAHPLEYVAEKAQLLERPAAAAFALDPSITVRDSEVTNVTAAPAIAPRKIRQTLRMTAALLS